MHLSISIPRTGEYPAWDLLQTCRRGRTSAWSSSGFPWQIVSCGRCCLLSRSPATLVWAWWKAWSNHLCQSRMIRDLKVVGIPILTSPLSPCDTNVPTICRGLDWDKASDSDGRKEYRRRENGQKLGTLNKERDGKRQSMEASRREIEWGHVDSDSSVFRIDSLQESSQRAYSWHAKQGEIQKDQQVDLVRPGALVELGKDVKEPRSGWGGRPHANMVSVVEKIEDCIVYLKLGFRRWHWALEEVRSIKPSECKLRPQILQESHEASRIVLASPDNIYVKKGDQRPAFDTLCGNEIRTLLGSNLWPVVEEAVIQGCDLAEYTEGSISSLSSSLSLQQPRHRPEVFNLVIDRIWAACQIVPVGQSHADPRQDCRSRGKHCKRLWWNWEVVQSTILPWREKGNWSPVDCQGKEGPSHSWDFRRCWPRTEARWRATGRFVWSRLLCRSCFCQKARWESARPSRATACSASLDFAWSRFGLEWNLHLRIVGAPCFEAFARAVQFAPTWIVSQGGCNNSGCFWAEPSEQEVFARVPTCCRMRGGNSRPYLGSLLRTSAASRWRPGHLNCHHCPSVHLHPRASFCCLQSPKSSNDLSELRIFQMLFSRRSLGPTMCRTPFSPWICLHAAWWNLPLQLMMPGCVDEDR